MIKHFGQEVKKMKDGNQYCPLYFDEISLRSGLYYNESENRVEGFEDFGSVGRTARSANHALVFMARGFRTRWKQPHAYYLCQSTTPAVILEDIILELIHALSSAGIYIKAVVSDQGSTNYSAVKGLLKRFPADNVNNNFLFRIDGEGISTRNNFQKYKIITPKGVASWEHIIKFKFGNEGCLYNLVNKITDAHVSPKDKDKIRIPLAAQNFNHSCSSTMNVLADCFHEVMFPEAKVIAGFLLFMNKLFDSVNGCSRFAPAHCPMWCWVSESSVCRLCFRQSDSTTKPGWMDNHNSRNADAMPRTLNQDGLENFFSGIRQHGGDNNNPTAGQFTADYIKNCENDEGRLLSTLGRFLTDGTRKTSTNYCMINSYVVFQVIKWKKKIFRCLQGDLSSEPNLVSVDGVSEVHCIIDVRDIGGKLEHPSL
ncbi:hypothetical protein PR048_011283 [Dryococelus australis]|uniref:Uncharacterized protein n=1 Tax=Dryococelus australis TaxID=614101 RepID=A0ABQ9HL71_9NEOP|nr:hypothetical protein PR048_011283 [Dryococelus australis]